MKRAIIPLIILAAIFAVSACENTAHVGIPADDTESAGVISSTEETPKKDITIAVQPESKDETTEVTVSESEEEINRLPETIQYGNLSLPTEGSYKKEGAAEFCCYDYAIVKRIDANYLLYDNSKRSPENFDEDGYLAYPEESCKGDYNYSVLRVGDKVGGLTVTEALSRYSIQYYNDKGTAGFARKNSEYNKFRLEGELTLKGMLEYIDGYGILWADPEGFGDKLPYLPAEVGVSVSEETEYDVKVMTSYPPIHFGRGGLADADISSITDDGLYEVEITVDGILFSYDRSGAFDGISAHAVAVDLV
ncbi:MAG: hypothetical protein J1E39_04055 [Eubacterium sp.]|nr:hypothetical protein [Eubacterium sp.]